MTMGLHEIIRKQCARTVRVLSEPDWQWRRRTSPATARQPTYGQLEDIDVISTSLREDVEPGETDETLGKSRRIRVYDQNEDGSAVSPLPVVDDQFVDPYGGAWVVTAIDSDGPGSRGYTVEYAEKLTLGPQRGRRE